MCTLDAEHKLTSYGALYLMAIGVYGTPPILTAWMANNSEPHYRRATTLALNIIAANAVCFSVKSVFISPLFIPYFLGGYPKYLEFSDQRRTKVQENNNYEPHFVSVLGFSILSLLILIHFE